MRTARLRAIRVRPDVTHCHDDASIVGLLTELRVHLVRVTVRARARARARVRARATARARVRVSARARVRVRVSARARAACTPARASMG